MAATPTPEEGKYKDIPSILPLAPGGVYAVKWEQREKWAQCIETPEVPYTPPLGEPNPDNPLCFFEVRSGGYYLGRVVFELKADTHPITTENFLKLCEYRCFAGTMFKVFPGNWIRGGDFTQLDDIVYDPNDGVDFFDFASLLPDAAPGGQSIYSNPETGPYFDDEAMDTYTHDAAGILTMFNPGSPNCNGSQFMITYPRVEPEVLDGSHVAFGQVTEGWNVLMALEQLGDARQEGLTFQRITLEQCGVLRYGKDGVGGAAAPPPAAAASVSVEASASAGRCGRGRRGGKASASAGKKVSSAARFGSAGARALAARFAYA